MINLATLDFQTEDNKQLTVTMKAVAGAVANQPNIAFSVNINPPGGNFELSFNDAVQFSSVINVLLNEE